MQAAVPFTIVEHNRMMPIFRECYYIIYIMIDDYLRCYHGYVCYFREGMNK